MDPVPRFPEFAPRDSIAVPSIPLIPQTSRVRNWRNLLRPRLIENAVLAGDIFLIVAAALVYDFGYQWLASGIFPNGHNFVGPGIIVAVNFAALMAARHAYQLKTLVRTTKQLWDMTIVWCGVYGLLAVVGFAMKVSDSFSRGSAILFFIGGLATLLSFRIAVARFVTKSLADGRFAKKDIIVIAERGKAQSCRALMELRRYGYNAVKTYEVSGQEIASPGITGSLRAKLAEVILVARNEPIEEIYLAVSWHHRRTIDGILAALAVLPINVHLVPDESAARFLKNPTKNIGDTWTAVLKRAPLSYAEQIAKRCFDLGLATAGLLILMPLMLATALLIKLDLRGPVFFVQKRNGFNGQVFSIIKFRTMHVLEDGHMVQQATRNDTRVTRLGRWLRRTSIDELPQLLNVVWGNMSLVGPRPHATVHDSEYERRIANYAFRHHVKPGLTGWAQVNGYRGETRELEQMQRRVEYDLWYINNWTPFLDLKIVLKTMAVTLLQTTAY